MKHSRHRNQKERASGGKQQLSVDHNRSLIRSLLSIVALIVVGLTSFIFIFPELITYLFPELSSSSFLYFFYSLSDLSTNLWITLKSSPITLPVSVVLCAVVLVVLLYRFCPYILTKDEHSFIKKKFFFPSYMITNVLQVSTVDSELIGRGFSASKSHINFSQALASNISSYQMLISKHESHVNIFFLISKRGLFKRKLLNNIQKEALFLTNLLSTHYGCSSKLLSVEQAKFLYQTLNKKNYSNNIDFSSLNKIETDALEMFYSTLSNTEHSNLSLLLEVNQKERNSSSFMLEITSFSDNVKALKHFIDATGLKRKRRLYPFNIPQFVSLEDLHKYTHIPADYKGTKFSLGQKTQTIMKYEQSILLGTNQSTMSDEEILLGIEELLFNTEIYGMIGRGKTRLVCSIIDQLISFEVPSIIFDIKDEYASTFVDDPNVDIYTIGGPNPLAINIFDTKDENDVHSTLLIIEEMMISSNQEFSPSMKNLFETALFLTHKAEERNLETFVEILLSLTKQKRQVPSVQLTLDAVLNRLNFIFNPINFGIICVKDTTLDFEALSQGKCIIMDLSQFQRRGGDLLIFS